MTPEDHHEIQMALMELQKQIKQLQFAVFGPPGQPPTMQQEENIRQAVYGDLLLQQSTPDHPEWTIKLPSNAPLTEEERHA
jgi:hypothetical protein